MRLVSQAVIIFIVFIAAVGCQDSNDSPNEPSITLDGLYEGVYQRIDGVSGENPIEISGRIDFAVDGDRYELKGSELNAPPFGCGSITGDNVVTMTDETRHTADFDWSLIVEGDFSVDFEDSKIVLERYDPERDRLVRLELQEN